MSDSVKEKFDTVELDWLDTNTVIIDEQGNPGPAGTSILLFNQIIFLKALTEDQLTKLAAVVTGAVNHELSKRK